MVEDKVDTESVQLHETVKTETAAIRPFLPDAVDDLYNMQPTKGSGRFKHIIASSRHTGGWYVNSGTDLTLPGKVGEVEAGGLSLRMGKREKRGAELPYANVEYNFGMVDPSHRDRKVAESLVREEAPEGYELFDTDYTNWSGEEDLPTDEDGRPMLEEGLDKHLKDNVHPWITKSASQTGKDWVQTDTRLGNMHIRINRYVRSEVADQYRRPTE